MSLIHIAGWLFVLPGYGIRSIEEQGLWIIVR